MPIDMVCTFIGIIFGTDIDNDDVIRMALLAPPPSPEGNGVVDCADLSDVKAGAECVDTSILLCGRLSSLMHQIMVKS